MRIWSIGMNTWLLLAMGCQGSLEPTFGSTQGPSASSNPGSEFLGSDGGLVPAGGGAGEEGTAGNGEGGGVLETPGGMAPPGAKLEDTPPAEPGVAHSRLARLSHAEYRNTVADLFPGVALPELPLSADQEVDGFTNNQGSLHPSALLTDQYHRAAVAVANAIEPQIDSLVPCQTSAGLVCAETFVRGFGRKALRRPVTDEELSDYLTYFEDENNSFEVAVQLSVMAMLQSADFLYRPELAESEPLDSGEVTLSAFEKASRLSYLLWASSPDDELLDAAAAGALDEDVSAQVDRLLSDETRARRGMLQFFSEWLHLTKVEEVLKEEDADWSAEVRADLAESLQRFVYDEVFANGGTSEALMTSVRYPSQLRVSELLNLPNAADRWETTAVDDGLRAGLLTHPAFLAAHGYGGYPSPVLRGVYIMDRILCTPPSPPPAAVTVMLPDAEAMAAQATTNRERYDEATGGPACITCHTLINGFGYALENYDTLGQYRETDNGKTVDASGAVFGFEFNNAVELAEQISQSNEYHECVVDKWLTYAAGGGPILGDAQLRADLVEHFDTEAHSLRSLVVGLANHPRFSQYLIPEKSQ